MPLPKAKNIQVRVAFDVKPKNTNGASTVIERRFDVVFATYPRKVRKKLLKRALFGLAAVQSANTTTYTLLRKSGAPDATFSFDDNATVTVERGRFQLLYSLSNGVQPPPANFAFGRFNNKRMDLFPSTLEYQFLVLQDSNGKFFAAEEGDGGAGDTGACAGLDCANPPDEFTFTSCFLNRCYPPPPAADNWFET